MAARLYDQNHRNANYIGDLDVTEEYQTHQTVQEIAVVRRTYRILTGERASDNDPQAPEVSKPKSRATKEKFAFPSPRQMKTEGRHFFCDSERVIALYNKAHTASRQKMTQTVQVWFSKRAKEEGWSSSLFLTETHTARIAGCMLYSAADKQGANHASTH